LLQLPVCESALRIHQEFYFQTDLARAPDQGQYEDLYALLYCNMHGAHGGSSGRFDRLHDTARRFAFILVLLNESD
jgi:hypothetical protein